MRLERFELLVMAFKTLDELCDKDFEIRFGLQSDTPGNLFELVRLRSEHFGCLLERFSLFPFLDLCL